MIEDKKDLQLRSNFIIFKIEAAKQLQLQKITLEGQKSTNVYEKLDRKIECFSPVSHEVAIALAHKHFEKFRIEQDKTFISDFDKEIKKLTGNKDEK